MCVLEHVGETFLDYPVGGDVDPAGQVEGITVDVQPRGEPGTPDVLQERAKTVEPRLGSELGALSVFTHRVQQVTHLRQCVAPRLLDDTRAGYLALADATAALWAGPGPEVTMR